MIIPSCLIHSSFCNGWVSFTETHLSYNWLLEYHTSCAWHTFQWIPRNLLATPRCPSIWEALSLGRSWPLNGAHDSNCESHRHCSHLFLLSNFSQCNHPPLASIGHHTTEVHLFIWFDLENTYGQKNNYKFYNPLKWMCNWVISTEAMFLKDYHVCMCVFIWVFIYLPCTVFGLYRDVAVPWSNAQALRVGSRVPKSKPLPTIKLSSNLCPFTPNLFTLSSFFFFIGHWTLEFLRQDSYWFKMNEIVKRCESAPDQRLRLELSSLILYSYSLKVCSPVHPHTPTSISGFIVFTFLGTSISKGRCHN